MTAKLPPLLSWPPQAAELETLRTILGRGGVLAVPTESSYALAVDPAHAEAVAAVFRIKGRGWHQPLPVAAASVAGLEELGVTFPPAIRGSLEALWPAPLTAVLPLTRPVAAAAGGETLAVRIPEHEGLRALLKEVGPLTVTSANRSGEPPALTAEAVLGLLAGEDAAVLDAGPLGGGPPSTLVRWDGPETGWTVLRSGAWMGVLEG